MKKKIWMIIAIFLIAMIGKAEIVKILLVDHNEMKVDRDEIIHLPGIGLGLMKTNDSIMLLDDPLLGYIRLKEPMEPRSLITVGSDIYAASGDSIYRIATDSLPRKFIGRIDNEQFTLSRAGNKSFFATTADEDFSCVYEIFPEDEECEPVIGIEGPIDKIEGNGRITMLWSDDTVFALTDDFRMQPIYQTANITDTSLTPMGMMVAATDGLHWLTGPDDEAVIVKEPVEAVWWEDAGVLYYLTTEGDLIEVLGLMERFLELNPDD